MKSSIDLGLFKSYHKDIKAICEEYGKDSQFWAFLSFKTKFVMQVFIIDIQAKNESLYMHSFSFFSEYESLSCASVIRYIKN